MEPQEEFQGTFEKMAQEKLPPSYDEWMTPEWVISIAVQSMGNGRIDLDPCSTDFANELVQAKVFYDKEHDGLSQEWQGKRLFMNPPYSRGNIDKWVSKLLHHWYKADIEQAFVVTNNVTDTLWAHKMYEACTALCYPQGRIHFLGPDGEPVKQTRQGQCFWYFGDNPRDFRQACTAHGVVLQRMSYSHKRRLILGD